MVRSLLLAGAISCNTMARSDTWPGKTSVKPEESPNEAVRHTLFVVRSRSISSAISSAMGEGLLLLASAPSHATQDICQA